MGARGFTNMGNWGDMFYKVATFKVGFRAHFVARRFYAVFIGFVNSS